MTDKMMTKEIILDTVKEYIAESLNCTKKDLEKDATVFVPNDKQKDPFLEICTIGQAVVVSASPAILPKVQKLVEGKSRDEIFEIPFVYGQSIYYVPDLKLLQKKPLNEQYQYELLQGNEIQKLRGIKGFENSLAFDEEGHTPTCIVFYAMKDGEIIALAGASQESDKMWEMGVDVKAEYRSEGLASILVSNLAVAIMEQGIVPIYCASVTNVGSQAVAHRSGLIPCWVSTYRTTLDRSSVYDDVVKKMQL